MNVSRFSLGIVLLSLLVLLGAAEKGFAQIHQTQITITKQGPTVSGFVGLALSNTAPPVACDVYVSCEDPAVPGATCDSGRINCTPTTTAAGLAAALAAGINANCPAGTTAVSAGNTLTISSPNPDVFCCIFANEMPLDGVGPFHQGLNLGDDGAGGFCSVRNVCNGVAGDEESFNALAGGFEFTKVDQEIPTVSEWGLMVLTLLLLTAGTIIFGRGRRMAKAA